MNRLLSGLTAAALYAPAAEPSSGGAPTTGAPPAPPEPGPASEPAKAPLFDAPADPAPADPPKPDPEPPAPPAEPDKLEPPAERPGALAARAALAQREAERARAQLEEQGKEMAQLKARVAKLDRLKEDPRLLLEEVGLSFEELSKRVLAGPPADPRTLELKAGLEEVRAELAKRDQQLQQRDVAMAVAQIQGKIAAALETGDKYEQARAAGWTPEKVWEEMDLAYQQSGRLPSYQETLDAIEAAELEALPKITSTSKAKARLAPTAPPPAKAPPAPARTLRSDLSAPPARKEVPRTPEQVISDFVRSGRKLRE